jgi:hypothetical protein
MFPSGPATCMRDRHVHRVAWRLRCHWSSTWSCATHPRSSSWWIRWLSHRGSTVGALRRAWPGDTADEGKRSELEILKSRAPILQGSPTWRSCTQGSPVTPPSCWTRSGWRKASSGSNCSAPPPGPRRRNAGSTRRHRPRLRVDCASRRRPSCGLRWSLSADGWDGRRRVG